ncbi:MAG: GNAT family N-acetyltransferase [Bacteroides sp.]|nr:GNAT family N-acetyltransferase [Bacteroides sp.]
MIRKAEANDIPKLAELFSQLHRHHCEIAPEKHRMPKEDFFAQRIASIAADEAQTVMVSDEDGINGYGVFKIINVTSEEKQPRRVCFIDCFAVAEKSRRKGVGSALFKGIREYALQKGCDAIQLGVDAENESAVGFYEKMGLVPRSIIMAKNIK